MERGKEALRGDHARGRFVRQIGRRGAGKGDLETADMKALADVFVDTPRHHVYVADGCRGWPIAYDGQDGRLRADVGRARQFAAADPGVTAAPFTSETGAGPSARNNQRIRAFTRARR